MTAATEPARQKAMDLLVRYGEALGAERLVETNNVAGAFNASTPSVRELVAERATTRFFRNSISTVPRWSPIPKMAVNTCQLITGIDNEQLAHPGHPGRTRRAAEEGRETFRRARHQHVRDLYAVSGRQRAGERRALRLDGILRRHLLQRRCWVRAPIPRARNRPARRR